MPCFLNLVRAPLAAAADLQRHLSDSDHHLEDRNEGDDSEDGLENSYGDLSLYLETWLLHGYPMGMGHGRSDTSGEGQAMYPGFDWIIYNIYIYLYMYTWIFQCRISAFWLACMDEEVAILHSWKIQVYLGSVLLPVVAVRKQLSCY